MSHFTLQVADAIAYLKTYSGFLAVFVAGPILVAIVMYAVAQLADGQPGTVGNLAPAEPLHPVKAPGPWGLDKVLVALLGILLLLSYVYILLHKEDFGASDNSQLTFYSLRGRSFGMPIWKETGRFFPLGLQEYNLIGAFSKSVFSYQAFSIVQLLGVIGGIFVLLRQAGLPVKVLTALIIFLSPGVTISFTGLIYPERNIIFFLTLLLVAVQQLSDTRRWGWFLLAAVAAQACLYYKETMFLLVAGVALFRIAASLWHLRWASERWRPTRATGLLRQVSVVLSRYTLELSLVALSAIFLLLYVVEILPNVDPSSLARGDERVASFQALVAYARTDYLLVLFVVCLAGRWIYQLANRAAFDPLWDALAFGAVLYGSAYIKLGMVADYYMAPVDFVAGLYLGQLAYRTGGSFSVSRLRYRQWGQLMLISATVTVVLSQNISGSSDYWLTRKNVIDGKVQLHHFFESTYASGAQRLYFTHQDSGFQLMEVSAFWDYKGLNLVYDDRYNDSAEATFSVASPNIFEDDLCIAYGRPYKCLHSDSPEAGDLIVVLPEDQPSANDLAQFSTEAMLLFHYRPQLSWVERGLARFSSQPVSTSDWLNAYVFEQRPSR